MSGQRSLFIATPQGMQIAPTGEPAPGRYDGVARIYKSKAGLFYKLADGGKVAGKYVVLEMTDGRLVVEFEDGKRMPAPGNISHQYLKDGLHFGTVAVEDVPKELIE